MDRTSPLRVAIVGLGTVGTSVVRLLGEHEATIAQRTGRAIEIVAVSARDRHKKRAVDLGAISWINDPLELTKDKRIDVIVELVGGSDGLALDLVTETLKSGKAVVTANKALLAHHGLDLARLSEDYRAPLLFEAAVAGGIPIIKTLREGLAGNDIRAVYGILNGTCNYILTEMRETGRDFADVLADAQAKGYAEADPAFDVDGIDTGHKLSLLSALAFGHPPAFDQVDITGIRRVAAADIGFAAELGYRIKLLGTAQRVDGCVSQSVEPCLVPTDSAIGGVEGVFNAVFIDSDYAGRSVSSGRGAGGMPTASAVVADLMDIARGHGLPVFGMPVSDLKPFAPLESGGLARAYYMHLKVLDRPGVLAETAAILRDHDISVESVLQRGRNPGKPVSIVMTTHPVKGRAMAAATSALSLLQCLTEPPHVLRIEAFQA